MTGSGGQVMSAKPGEPRSLLDQDCTLICICVPFSNLHHGIPCLCDGLSTMAEGGGFDRPVRPCGRACAMRSSTRSSMAVWRPVIGYRLLGYGRDYLPRAKGARPGLFGPVGEGRRRYQPAPCGRRRLPVSRRSDRRRRNRILSAATLDIVRPYARLIVLDSAEEGACFGRQGLVAPTGFVSTGHDKHSARHRGRARYSAASASAC